MTQPTIVVQLSSAFNAEASDVKTLLGKYDAQLKVSSGSYYNVTGVENAAAFIEEFKNIKGVTAAYLKPAASHP